MGERIIQCPCGQRMRVPTRALGETIPCAACRAPLSVTLQNSRACDEHPYDNGAYPAHGGDAPQGPRCARCGRPFRGEWDRNPTANGVLCHICAHQYAPPPPEEPKKQTAGGESLIGAQSFNPPPNWNPEPLGQEPAAGIPGDPLSRYRRQQREAFWAKAKSPLIFALLVCIGLGLVLALPISEWIAQLMSSASDTESAELSPVSNGVLVASKYAFSFLRSFLVLFIALHVLKRLPNDSFGKNLIAVGAVALLLWALDFLALNHYLGIVVLVAQVGIVFHLYDLEFKDIFVFFFVGLLLSPAFWALEALFQGLIAAIAC